MSGERRRAVLLLSGGLDSAATLAIASPTVLASAHPKVAYAAYMANLLKPKVKYAAFMGSYGWGGRMVDRFLDLMPDMKVEVLDPVLVRGEPKETDYAALDKLADTIA